MKSITKDKLNIEIYDTRAEMGNAAGNRAAELIKNALNEKSEVNVIFAAAPSQNETLAKLISCEGNALMRSTWMNISDWKRMRLKASVIF